MTTELNDEQVQVNPKKVKQSRFFSEKNSRRRASYQPGNPDHLQARSIRRALGGAFGNVDDSIKERAYIGTSFDVSG